MKDRLADRAKRAIFSEIARGMSRADLERHYADSSLVMIELVREGLAGPKARSLRERVKEAHNG